MGTMSNYHRIVLKLVVLLTLASVATLILLAALPEQYSVPESESAGAGPPVGNPQHRAAVLPAVPPSMLGVNSIIESLKDRAAAIEFYGRFSGNEGIAETIMERALELDLPVHVAFALAWRESRFDPRAVSPPNRGGTRDWGLFQLNDGGRRDWSAGDFFNVEKNTHNALSYLRQCIASMGDLELGLAAYNAGIYGVRTRGIPATTRKYIQSILAYEKGLDKAFGREIAAFVPGDGSATAID